jgi:peptidyl-dipeptidase Dcp
MKTSILSLAVCGLLLATSANAAKPKPVPAPAPAPAPFTPDNPFATESSLPYHLPPFDRIKDAAFRPAFEAGMAEQRREVEAIARSADAPTFDNTVVALERTGLLLARVSAVFFNLTSSNTNPELDTIEQEMAPKLSSHRDSIFLDPTLFARVKDLYDRRASLGLDPESERLLERYRTTFVRAGAALSEPDKAKLRKMNEEVSSLTTQFQQNVLKATNASAVVVDSASELEGLPAEQIAAAAQEAESRKLKGKWVLTLQNTTGQPVLAQLTNRALRERVFRASVGRANGGPNDNTAVAARLVKLRAERAALLGYPSHAAYVLEDETAGTTAAVNKMLSDLAPAAEANARKEATEMQKVVDEQAKAAGRESFQLQPWDWAFYSEQVRKAKYAYDESQVRPYFELEHVLEDGVFFAAHELYGLTFKERTDLPVYEPSVRAFEVFNEDGSQLGLFLADYFARGNKQGGAWMSEYVSQSGLRGTKPVVVNNLNIVKAPKGQPVLLTFSEVSTLFHEFGHGLHGLFSNVRYPLFAGTAVPTDFVEYPSQYNEMWASDPKVLAHYAKHYQTGEPMPKALMDKILAAQTFNEGFLTSEYLAATLVDQAFHQIPASEAPAAKDVMAFEAKALEKNGVNFDLVPPRYHAAYFLHIFSNDYSAGYYSYLWSDVLAKDTQHWFETHGGLQRANGDFLRAKVLSRGFSADSTTLFKEFYGGEPEVGPLLEHRGLVIEKTRR